ncbi:uncharacterized protein LOC144435968 [Glandiceps talaboti]
MMTRIVYLALLFVILLTLCDADNDIEIRRNLLRKRFPKAFKQPESGNTNNRLARKKDSTLERSITSRDEDTVPFVISSDDSSQPDGSQNSLSGWSLCGWLPCEG